MFVSELKKVIAIDTRITSLHQELAGLYSERQKYIQQSTTVSVLPKALSKTSNTLADNAWLTHSYEYLAKAWALYGIKIPSLGQLKKGLLKANETITELSNTSSELSGKLGLLLVPPVQILGQPGDRRFRRQQAFIHLDDYFNVSLLKRYQQKSWRLLVVYQHETPLNKGKASDILAEKKYQLGAYDARGLGIYEYYAFSLQSPLPLDRQTWTLLLKGTTITSKTVASVTFVNGQYRFEVDDTDGVFGDERFRPAIEVASI